MALQILLNIGIAFIWMLLNSSFSFVDFTIGYILGIVLFYLLRRFLKYEFYFTRVIALIKLTLIFIKEMIIANLKLVKIVLSPKMKINPGIIAYETQLKTNFGKTTLAALIGLTPGTLVMAYSDDEQTLYIHNVHIDDKEQAIKDIRQSFEKTMLEVSRDA